MAGDLPLDSAHLVGFAVGMLMYGWYFGLLTRAIPVVWARRSRSRVMLWVTSLMFLVTTLNLVLCAVDEYAAFIQHREGLGVIAYLSHRTFVKIRSVSTLLLCEAGILLDTLVVWRLYAIWNKSALVVIFPAALLVVDFGIGIAICIMTITTRGTYRGELEASIVLSILIAINTLLLNIYSTAMIIARIWWVARRAQSSHGRKLYKAVTVSLVESGALYTATLTVYSVLEIVRYDGWGDLFKYILMMVIAIAPLLIVMHLNATFSTPPNNNHSTTAGSEVAVPSRARAGAPDARVVFSPIESYQFKTFRTSQPTDEPQTASSTSARGSRTGRQVSTTVPSLSSCDTEMRLRLEEDQDPAKVEVEKHAEGDEAGMPPEFAPVLDYISRSDKEAV